MQRKMYYSIALYREHFYYSTVWFGPGLDSRRRHGEMKVNGRLSFTHCSSLALKVFEMVVQIQIGKDQLKSILSATVVLARGHVGCRYTV